MPKNLPKIKAIILDDDSQSTKFISNLCKEYFSDDIEIKATFNHPQEALKEFNERIADMIFLDIEMPGFDGFEFIASLPQGTKSKIVVISSFDKYALRAIKNSVFDYLPKPISIKDMRTCINRFNKLRLEQMNPEEETLKDNLLIINRHDKAVFIEVNDILRFEANGSYTEIFMENGGRINSTKNIMYYEGLLERHNFYKVHRSHLINLNKVKELIKYDGDGVIIMQDNSKIGISRAKKNEFLRTLTRT